MVAFGYISTMDEQSLFAEHLLQFWESMGFDFDRLSSNPNITFDMLCRKFAKNIRIACCFLVAILNEYL